MVTQTSRDSNNELLRIVCMFFIVSLHFIILAAFPCIWDENATSKEVTIAAMLNGFLYLAVNCYILISGFYGIKLKLKSIANLYFLCAFYALIGYLIHLGVDHQHIGKGLLWHSIFCISHSKLWFIKCYVALLLMSPLINYGINSMKKHEYQAVLVLFTTLNVYFGYLWDDETFNSDGYNVAQFVYLYLIGGYIRRYANYSAASNRWRHFFVYICCSLCWGGLTILSHHYSLFIWNEWAYNNPILLISAIAFFLFFQTFHFKSPWINAIAPSTLAIYVIHCGDYYSHWILSFVKYYGNIVQDKVSIIAEVAFLFIAAAVLMAIIILIEQFRLLLMKPVWYVYYRVINYAKDRLPLHQ